MFFLPEHALELLSQAASGGAQHHLLVNGQVATTVVLRFGHGVPLKWKGSGSHDPIVLLGGAMLDGRVRTTTPAAFANMPAHGPHPVPRPRAPSLPEQTPQRRDRSTCVALDCPKTR
jgi:hypothetical protein